MRNTIICLFVLIAAACEVDPGDSQAGVGDGSVSVDPGSIEDSATTTSSSTATTGPYFTTPMFFNTDVSSAAKSANSATIISALSAAGGWGNSGKMQIDFEIDVLTANASTPKQSFTPNDDFSSPDCDQAPVPIPAGGDIEGETGYACTGGDDCHLLVNDTAGKKLYEMYRADIEGSTFSGGCLAVWDLTKTYTNALRGMQCTSADAAGFPISPLLFTADEVKAGHIDHAIRFILPNDRVQRGFVPPATHATNTTGGSSSPYYGVHLRLRADYPIANLSAGAQVVAKAMQKYGMYHADGGQIALTAQSDKHTTAKWSGLLGSKDLAALKVTDFDVIDQGSPITLTFDCTR